MKFQFSDIYIIFYFISFIIWLTIQNLKYKVKISKNFENQDLGIEFRQIAEDKLYFRKTLAWTSFHMGSIITFIIMIIGHVLFSLNINTIITANIGNIGAPSESILLSTCKIMVFVTGGSSLFMINDFEYLILNKDNKLYKKLFELNYIKHFEKSVEKSLNKNKTNLNNKNSINEITI